MDIAALAREIRERLDLTQAELARLLKVSLPTINRWEAGRTQPDAMALHVIEEFLRKRGLKCSDLLSRYFGAAGTAKPATRRRRGSQRPAEDDAPNGGLLDTKSMEGMLWKAACSIRPGESCRESHGSTG